MRSSPLACRTAARTRLPTSVVGSPGSVTISPSPDAQRGERHGLRHGRGTERDALLVALPGHGQRVAHALERRVRDVEQRTALLLRPGEEREADHRVVRHVAALGGLPAEAGAGPAHVELRRGGERRAGAAPGADHRGRLHSAHVVGRRGAVAHEPGRLVALVRVAVDVQDELAARHAAGAAHALLEHLDRRGVVVLVVVLEARLRDRAVVGERGPAADRDAAPPPDDLVHAQHVHARVDGVVDALGILGRGAAAALAHDVVVGQVRLDAAVHRQPVDLGAAPPGAGWAEVGVRTPRPRRSPGGPGTCRAAGPRAASRGAGRSSAGRWPSRGPAPRC